jgi:hypothetical protein
MFIFSTLDLPKVRPETVAPVEVGAPAGETRALPARLPMPVGTDHSGLVAMPAHDRTGSPVLGTGFTRAAGT